MTATQPHRCDTHNPSGADRSHVGSQQPVYDRHISETDSNAQYLLRPIGHVESPLVRTDDAPKQGTEGSPEARIVFDEGVREGLRDLRIGDEIFVLTWLHQAQRDTLVLHPRGDVARPQQGVFSTRSQDRPNPVGLHRVEITGIDGIRIRVRNLEAVNETPVIDVKPVLRLGTDY